MLLYLLHYNSYTSPHINRRIVPGWRHDKTTFFRKENLAIIGANIRQTSISSPTARHRPQREGAQAQCLHVRSFLGKDWLPAWQGLSVDAGKVKREMPFTSHHPLVNGLLMYVVHDGKIESKWVGSMQLRLLAIM